MSRCFSDDSLRRLGDEGVDPSHFQVVERHVQTCPRCGPRLEALARECLSLPSEQPTGVTEGTASLPELDDFVIESEIGRGAMGVVHLARDRRLGRAVALKVLSHSGTDADARRRWLREARAISKVRHPNVVSLYDCREVGPWLVLVLEYVPGGSLARRVSGPLPPRAAAGLMEKIARAVGYVHGQGVLHLDLKPSNILLDGEINGSWEQTIPLISDFGLALFHDEEGTEPTQDGPRGTPSYMAPEQTTERRSRLGPAADVYALGVVLYELLSGRPPFRAASTHETMELARHQDPVPLRRLNPRAPRDLETIAHRCLIKAPDKRYKSAEALADDLRRWLDGHPIKARRASVAGRAWRVCRRHQGASLLGLALLATIATSFGLLVQAYARAEAARQTAEQNFEIATAVTERLEDIMLGAFTDRRGIDVDRLESAANLLREQIRRGRTIQGFKTNILAGLAAIDERLAFWHLSKRRSQEALELAIEERDRASECYAADPTNVVVMQAYADALHFAAFAEEQARHWVESLDHLDAASEFIRNASPTLPDQLWRASYYSAIYLGLRGHLIHEGRVEEARRAFDGHLRLMALLEVEEPGRPARSLFLAGALADRGEIERARKVAARAIAEPQVTTTGSERSRWELQAAAQAWFTQELKFWIQDLVSQQSGLDAVEKNVESYLAHFHAWRRALGVDGPPDLWSDDFCGSASQLRQEGRNEDAELTTALFLAMADHFVRSYPDEPSSYQALGQAYIQQAKNAWRRKDLAEIRHAESRAIDALRKAQQLAPGDVEIRAELALHQGRLDALPLDSIDEPGTGK